MSNRKAAIAEAIKWVNKLLPGGEMGKIYQAQFDAMNDEQFDTYMERLASGEEILPLYAPNLNENKLSVERNLKVADELGHKFFQRLWLTDPQTGKRYLTPVEYLIVDLPVRRQAQMLVTKIKIPENNRHVDELTGQPTGPSKGSKISFPETQVIYAQGLDAPLVEFLKIRGGDIKAFQEMNRSIFNTGGVSLAHLAKTPTVTRSVQTASILLKAAHLQNNLAG